MVKLKETESHGMKRRSKVAVYSKACVLCRVVVTFSLNIHLIMDAIISADVCAAWTPQSRLLDSLSATCVSPSCLVRDDDL